MRDNFRNTAAGVLMTPYLHTLGLASFSVAFTFCQLSSLPFFLSTNAAFASTNFDPKSKVKPFDGKLIVKFQSNMVGKEQQAVDVFLARKILNSLHGEVTHTFRSSGAFVVEFPDLANLDASEALGFLSARASELRNNKNVLYVEENQVFHILQSSLDEEAAAQNKTKSPSETLASRKIISRAKSFSRLGNVWKSAAGADDERFSEQWALQNKAFPGIDLAAPFAWSHAVGNRSVKVGVIDTGIDSSHIDLAQNIWRNPGESGLDTQGRDKARNGVDDDGNGFIDDVSGWDFVDNDNVAQDDNEHGTHVAGTIGAVGNNGIGVSGVVWHASLVPIKFLDSFGYGSLENAIKAIEYATAVGVKVTNNSWGGGTYSRALEEAISEANQKGIVFVAAAGNDSSDNDKEPHFPSNYALPNVVAVAALSQNGHLAEFSNYGRNLVQIAAPGEDILSTVPGNNYAQLSGTSMASPHVTGAIALLLAKFPSEKPSQALRRLLVNAKPLNTLSDFIRGGLLSFANAFAAPANIPTSPRGTTVRPTGLRALGINWRQQSELPEENLSSSYEFRWSDKPILNESDYEHATLVNHAELVVASKSEVEAALPYFPFEGAGYVSIRRFGADGQASSLTPSARFALPKLTTVSVNDASSMIGTESTGKWGIENGAFSDSPGEKYNNKEDTSLTLLPVHVPSKFAAISFDSFASIEETYDFGYVEINVNGSSNWNTVAKISNDNKIWENLRIDISDFLKETKNDISIRFRLVTDSTDARDGWKIDNIRIQSASLSPSF